MSILIKGMEMPTEGWHKVIKIFSDGTAISYYDSVELGKAVPVPPHYGRLIDGDELEQQMVSRKNYIGRLSDPLCLVQDAPTIIESNRKEG